MRPKSKVHVCLTFRCLLLSTLCCSCKPRTCRDYAGGQDCTGKELAAACLLSTTWRVCVLTLTVDGSSPPPHRGLWFRVSHLYTHLTFSLAPFPFLLVFLLCLSAATCNSGIATGITYASGPGTTPPIVQCVTDAAVTPNGARWAATSTSGRCTPVCRGAPPTLANGEQLRLMHDASL